MNKAALAVLVAALAIPAAARADLGLRLGGETVIARHTNSPSSTSWITDHWEPSANLMLSYWLPGSIVSFDAEISERWYVNPPAGVNGRTGTTLRLGATLTPAVLPIYVHGSIPIHLEPSPVTTYVRVGAGLTANFVVTSLYIETNVDFPLGGGSGSPDAFSQQEWSVGAGLQFKL